MSLDPALVVRQNPRRRPFDGDAPRTALLDGLVLFAALRDDSCRWCELGPINLRAKQPADHTTIILEDVGEPANADRPEAPLLRADDHAAVARAVESLPEPTRTAVRLRFGLGGGAP